MADDKTLLDTVGNTPLVRVDRVLPAEAKANDVRVLCKLEMQNPGGSVKDRIALNLIADAEKKGLLRPGMTVVEYTSGNTGIGLAMVGRLRRLLVAPLRRFQTRTNGRADPPSFAKWTGKRTRGNETIVLRQRNVVLTLCFSVA